MDLQALNKICFMICLVCIVTGVVLGLGVIWIDTGREFFWRGFATVGVVFIGAALTLSVSRTFGGRNSERPPVDHQD